MLTQWPYISEQAYICHTQGCRTPSGQHSTQHLSAPTHTEQFLSFITWIPFLKNLFIWWIIAFISNTHSSSWSKYFAQAATHFLIFTPSSSLTVLISDKGAFCLLCVSVYLHVLSHARIFVCLSGPNLNLYLETVLTPSLSLSFCLPARFTHALCSYPHTCRKLARSMNFSISCNPKDNTDLEKIVKKCAEFSSASL